MSHCSGSLVWHQSSNAVGFTDIVNCCLRGGEGGKAQIAMAIMEKVPHKQRQLLELIEKLIEEVILEGVWGKERFWMRWNLLF